MEEYSLSKSEAKEHADQANNLVNSISDSIDLFNKMIP